MPGVMEEGGTHSWSTGGFRVGRLLGVILQWWDHVLTHLSRLTECTQTPSLNRGETTTFGGDEVLVQVPRS